ncbi:chemotaxis protein CheX [Sulfurimonas sp. MAG313]|nr:chemotaxis protein CheX [Sulfurimonas sp. MAG313]MDF1880522.1 chemotaxis protein CheX [Sulfurimonas sp. MAG313]
MINVLKEASKNFVQHQLRLELTPSSLQTDTDFYHVNMSLTKNGETILTDFYYTLAFIDLICLAMLGETAEDDETINDLIGETTNQIAGSAKILADNTFDIGLPCVLSKVRLSPENGTLNAFCIDNTMMFCIAMK